MTPPPVHRLDADALIALASTPDRSHACDTCHPLQNPGWESMPGSFDRQTLAQAATLRDETIEDPTLQEHHPDGTHSWSPDAPIALAYYPYNRCDVWTCTDCRRVYLRYTEYGGYYVDERVRMVRPELVVADAPPPPG